MASAEQFQHVEQEYFRLRGQLSVGRITPEQFDAALAGLMLQDAHGSYWMVGKDSGRWYVHNGQAWVEANPYAALPPAPSGGQRPPAGSRVPVQPPTSYQTPPAAAAPAKQQGGGCGSCLGYGCLTLLVLLVVAGIGGYIAYQNGTLTLASLLRLAGLGPGSIEVVNLRDDAVNVSFTQLDPPQDSSPAQSGSLILAFDISNYTIGQPGQYRAEFGTNSGSADLGSCTMTVRAGDQYQFVALPETIAVHDIHRPPSKGADLVLETSSICRK